MLKLIAPPDTKTLSETKKQSSYFNKLTGDTGDLRFFKDAEGKRTFLRIWVGDGHKAGKDSGPQWFEVIPQTPEPSSVTDTK